MDLQVFSKQEVTYYKSLENPTTMLENKYQREIEEHGIEGSILFTYVHADEFNLKSESSRTVTTSITERLNHLTWNIFGGGASTATHKLAQPVHFQSMCIVAELESDEREEKVCLPSTQTLIRSISVRAPWLLNSGLRLKWRKKCPKITF